MCGIAGTVSFDGEPADMALLEAMAGALAHRGPDASGFHADGPFGLAHRRLSIIDLQGGAQPLANEDFTIWTVFNGEIYNFKELRNELEGRGHVFKTVSDTEVIVHLYEEHGTEFPKRLNGMFAIAVLDSRRRRLVLARDRFGKKPLVYFRTDSCFAFASELAALRLHPQMPRTPDLQALWDYFSLQYIPSPRTVFKGVCKLSPGQVLELDLAERFTKTHRYWSHDFSVKSEMDYDDAKIELRKLLSDAVERRLVADVPLGAFLSGGLDSSVIAGLMCEVSKGPVKTFTIGFDDPSYDEREAAAAAAAHFRNVSKVPFESSVRVVEPQDFPSLELLVKHFGEPFADASMLPTYMLSKFARESVTVALSGDGADEVFGGYERYLAMKWARLADFIPYAVRRPVFGSIAELMPASSAERSLQGRARRFVKALGSDSSQRYLDMISRFDEDLKRSVAGPLFDSMPHGSTHDYIKLVISHASSGDAVERLMEADIDSYLPCDILPKIDIASMACSLELRSPFLDYRVLEFSATLPRHYKQAGSVRKRILADAFADLIPPGVAKRPKRGFGVPVASWLRGAWLPVLKERLLEGRALKEGFIERAGAEALIEEHVSMKADRSYPLFSLLVLELFLGQGRQ